MQRPKEKIRERILQAAQEEFVTVGYRQASMRKIAERSGITPGNIYAYFHGKDDLFDQVVAPTLESLSQLVWGVSKGTNLSDNSVRQITDAVAEVFRQNKKGFLILTDFSDGSHHEDMKRSIVSVVQKRLTDEFLPQLPEAMRSHLLAKALATAIIEGILCLFREYHDDDTQLYQGLNEFITIVLGGMSTMTDLSGKEGRSDGGICSPGTCL
ncbi:TetR/AcrR family transcriptional regulator [Zongyangia hominis]|uniref:TetR/AcrR family transcriptional regulator n=1 Tax=Zongyangia hominis TaxID=2763677 RepID=A0A926ECI9_9FIRM|nr:TetR/AcrR family transcriptional regulator [Zongyangia hominis]MBC8569724.1 TetR/AcrR family transcriptional regulator [Zongyangia hominis]